MGMVAGGSLWVMGEWAVGYWIVGVISFLENIWFDRLTVVL